MSVHQEDVRDQPGVLATGSEAPVAQARDFLFAPLFRALRPTSDRLSSFFSFVAQKWSTGTRWLLGWSLQGFERLFFRSHVTRASTRLSLGQSARGVASIGPNNSKMSAGASINIAEMVDIIDKALAGGMREDAWSNIFEGLETVTQACPNNRLPLETPEHTFSSEELQLVVLAAESSSAAYANSDAQPGSRSPQILRSVEQATSAALDGSVKACALAIANSPTDRPLLAVAFRGTVSLADWLVNLDGGLEDCADFLGSPGATAHAGLLRVAKAMAPRVCEKIISASSTIGPDLDGGRPSLVITGHSAGGGVAGLISAHIRATRPDILDRFEVIHCVTFAAPPVLGSLPSGDDAPPVSAGLSLNIVNYGDMVPRADKAYIRSLLTLYRERAESNTSEPWDFGDPDAWNYGKNIVVMDVAAADDGGDIQDDVSDLRAFDVGPHIWKTLAFGSKKTHPMAVYLQSVRSLIRS